jgi:flagellar biosynthesis protein FlhA
MLNQILQTIGKAFRHSDLFLAAAVIFILLLLVIPLTDYALDFLISVSIVISVLTLLVTLYTEETLSFNAFPSFLLFLTLFRLGLNIASTRMILTEGHAGYIIKTFGEVVTGGNAFVGFVIFLLLTGINFVVITKGSGRVAEVAARFTLDSLPGKQLAIDADVNAGLIDEKTAKERRDKIMVEADFYGAMDGASKFVRGDAIAGMVIILVNIVGGFIVGMVIKGMSWDQVIKVYITLTVGDGLVTQIPALLVSVGAGIIVTRSSTKENLAESFRKQLFNSPKVLTITSTILFLLGCVPGMPQLVIFPIVATLYFYAFYLSKLPEFQKDLEKSHDLHGSLELRGKKLEDVEKILFIDPMEIELGHRLTSLVEEKKGNNLLKRISLIRRQIAMEMGIVVPSIRIKDNLMLNAESYLIKIKGNEVALGMLHIDNYLAMNPGTVKQTITGIPSLEPAFGLPALWIKASLKDYAVNCGYIVADPMTVLMTHLTEVIRSHANELVNRQEVAKLIDNTREIAPAVISELVPAKLSIGQVLRVLQNLLRERVSIRDMVTILEILADSISRTTDMEALTEYVRQGLARTLTKQYTSDNNKLFVIVLDPKVEEMLIESLQTSNLGKMVIINPSIANKIIYQTRDIIKKAATRGVQPVFMTSAPLRPYFKRFIERTLPRLPVLSIYEIVPDMEIETLGVVTMDVLAKEGIGV